MSTPDAGPAVTGTLTDLVDQQAGHRPGTEWILTPSSVTTYADARRRGDAAAAALFELGVRRGDRVVAAVPNRAEVALLLMACAHLGAILVPTNPTGSPAELAGIVRQAEPRVLVMDKNSTNALARDALDQLGEVDVVLDDAEAICSGSGRRPVAEVSPDDTLMLMPTSGSTSSPKLVTHTHKSLLLTAESFPSWLGLGSADRLLSPLPLFHANALVYSLLGSLSVGASLVLLPRFSASTFWDQTRDFGATQFNAMGNMGEILMRGPHRPDDADNPVRICYSAWALSRERHDAFERRFGLELMVGYGLSESGYGTAWPIGEPKPYGTIGRLRQHPRFGTINRALVVDEAGAEVPAGRSGTLLLSNPATMKGYWRMPRETAAVLHDGWLNTGDIVRQNDDGTFTYVGRGKDIIRRGGENFAPIEVEEALDAHPSVHSSAVVAVPSPMLEDDAKAYVVLERGDEIDALALLDWCRGRLAHFKLPRYIEFVADLPMTETGRIAKGRLSRERNSREHDLEHRRRISRTAS